MEQKMSSHLSQSLSQPQLWTHKTHLFFGWDGTLLNCNFDKLFWGEIVPNTYSKIHSLNIEQSKSLLQSYMNAVADTLELYSVDYWENKLGINILDLKQKHSYLIKLNEHVEKLLFYVFSLNPKPKCHIISNTHPNVLDYKIKFLGLDHFFDSITSSLSFKMLKQDRNFWPCYLQQLQVDPSSAILFESNIHTVNVAAEAGLTSIMLTDNEQECKEDKAITPIRYIKNFKAIMPKKLTNVDIIPNFNK